MKVLVCGASGRIGREIERLAEAGAGVDIAGRANRSGFFDEDAEGDVLIDFSRPAATALCIELAAARGMPMVIGTTGIDPALQADIERAAASIAICQAANYSIGVTMLLDLVARAAAGLPSSFEAEILELHHRWKVDAPSGTAIALGEAVAKARDAGSAGAAEIRRGGPRRPEEIGYQVARGGDAAGEHTVLFLGDGERLELVHRATDRGVFARGAVHAARWLLGRAPGLYSMRDVVGDR